MQYRDLLLYNLIHQPLSVTVHVFLAFGPLVMFLFADKDQELALTVVTCVALYLAGWLLQCLYTVVYLLLGNHKSILTQKVLELHDDALFDETRYNRSYRYWPGILKAVRRPGFIAIYTSALTAHVIPHRAFLNEIDREKFWVALNRKLKK